MPTRPVLVLVAIAVLGSVTASPVAAVSPGTPGPILFSRYSGELQDDYLYTVVPGSEAVIVPGTAGTFGGRWSPDGRVIAYTVYMEGVYLINSDGSGKRLIVPDVPEARAGGGVWSPDGTKLAYGVGVEGSAEALVGIFGTVDGESQVFDAGLDSVLEWTDEYLLGMAWRDYDQIMNKNAELARWVFDEPGGDPSQGTLEFLTDNYTQDGVPRLSPDGSTIVWHVYNLGWPDGTNPVGNGERSLWLMNADGSNQRKLIDLEDQVTWPAWSPDGTEVVFGPTITAVNVSTGATRPIEFGWGIPGDGFDWAPLPGTTDDFPIAGVRALAHPDPSAVATASASATTIKPSSTAPSAVDYMEAAAAPRSVTIRQYLAEPARATLKIFKPSGALMRTIDHGLKTGSVSYTWNGRLPNGKRAPVGKYKFVAKAVDLAGNVKKKVMYVKVVR